MATSFERRRQELGEQLRQLRQDAGLNAKEIAGVLGWNAPKVSKIERGRQTVSQEDLDAWLAAVDASPEVVQELSAELETLNAEYLAWRERVRDGRRDLQESMLAREARARRIRAVEFGLVPGLLQTADYATHVFQASRAMFGGTDDTADAVRMRMQRQQVLYEAGKTIELIVAEMALLHPIAPPAVMIGQIHRLVATIGVPNVRFGILPARRQLPFWPVEGFWMVDDWVSIELLAREQRAIDPEEVAVYHDLVDRLWEVAVEGDEARALLLRMSDEYARDIAGKPS